MAKNKEIMCVYQDCPMCGARGAKINDIVKKENITIKKVSFASAKGKELIFEALSEHKIGTMPFFTDGKKFSTNIADFAKKPARKKKGGKNGLAE